MASSGTLAWTTPSSLPPVVTHLCVPHRFRLLPDWAQASSFHLLRLVWLGGTRSWIGAVNPPPTLLLSPALIHAHSACFLLPFLEAGPQPGSAGLQGVCSDLTPSSVPPRLCLEVDFPTLETHPGWMGWMGWMAGWLAGGFSADLSGLGSDGGLEQVRAFLGTPGFSGSSDLLLCRGSLVPVGRQG